MAITPKPPKRNADDFIKGAPDNQQIVNNDDKKQRGAPKKEQRKVALSMSMDANLLARLDAKAKQLGQSRAALFNMAVYNLVENGIEIDG